MEKKEKIVVFYFLKSQEDRWSFQGLSMLWKENIRMDIGVKSS
jgi:hypothetical protein